MTSSSGALRPPIVVVSNRGPLNFRRQPDGTLAPSKGGGGLVTSLAPAIAGSEATWVCSTTLGAHDAPDTDWNGLHVRHVPIDPRAYRRFYDVIANGMLWFLHHNLFDAARTPRIDRDWWTSWDTYCEVNRRFAEVVADTAPEGAAVMVHDYHLTLLGKHLRSARPDLRTVHFHHIPFAGPDTLAMMPTDAAQVLLEGLAGHDACGFHSLRWAENFRRCCEARLGGAPRTFASTAAPDVTDLRAVAGSSACADALEELERRTSGRKVIVRVDRMELSKNLLRGFAAFEALLREHSSWREKVVFVAHLYPSREGVAEYVTYRSEVEELVRRINDEWSTEGWQPVELTVDDDFPRAVAAYLRYDVLLVNPIRDGLNLVAKEGALMNQRDGAVVLSRETGAWDELSSAALGVNPFDVTDTTDALRYALEMSPAERAERAERLRQAVAEQTPQDWLADQLRAVDA